MKRRRIERITVVILSIAMLLSTTGIFPSLAANVSVSDSASETTVKNTSSVSETTSTASSTTTKVTVNTTSDVQDGTAANPYKVSTINDFIGMQNIINNASSSVKYFILTSDIDLSTAIASDFKNNNALISSKENTPFVLEGNGHKLTGIAVTTDKNIAIFGNVSSKSVIQNLVVSSPSINVTSENISALSVLSLENQGVITNVKIEKPVLTFKNCSNCGLISAVNKGIISNVLVAGSITNVNVATAESHTICGSGSIGAVAGLNSGKIKSASALNIGTYIINNKVDSFYGGITGTGTGVISNSVSTGSVSGGNNSDYSGGIVGKANKDLTLTNNYTLVANNSSTVAYAVIGFGGNNASVSDCFWSREISKCSLMYADCYNYSTNISKLNFKVINNGSSAKISTEDLNCEWGKASFAVTDNYSVSGSGISMNVSDSVVSINGIKADTVNSLKYNTTITLPSTVGYSTSSVKINQKMSVSILVIPSGVAQKGTKDEPFIINNSAEMKMLASAHGIYAKLGKNISGSYSAFNFYGTLDGAGHSLTVTSQVFRNVYGSIINLNVIVKSDISTAVLGNAHNAKINSVNVELASGNKFIAKTNNTGCLFNIIAGKTVIENTTVKADVELAENCSNIGIFAGNIKGNNTEISNSGSCGNIAIKNNVSASNVANFAGIIFGENISVSSCYTSGKNDAGNTSFAGAILNKNVEFNNIYLTNDCKDAVDFTKYSFVDKNQFNEWKFGQNNIAFFTGNSGSFEISKPEIPMIKNSSVSDYKLSFNNTKINASITVKDKIVLKVSRPNGVVTVKNEPVTIVNKRTGLSITLIVSNGLEKTKDGRYVISSSYDLFYVSENVEEIGNASFVMNGNIDMSSIKNFAPIGTISNPFTGKFDGNGFTIINLSVNSGAMSGLFGFVNNAEIKNVKLDKANVVSKGSYSGALLGSAKNTKVDTITVINANIKAQDINSGVLAGSFSGGSIQNIYISNSQIISTSNYVGSVAGRIDSEAVLKSVQINKLSVEGSEFISGVVGLCDGKSVITDASVTDSTVKGLSNVSGIASGNSLFSKLDNIKVVSSKVLADGTASSPAGGISSEFGGTIKNSEVNLSSVTAEISSGIVAEASKNCSLDIQDAKLVSTEVKGSKVAAGAIAVFNTKGNATVNNCFVDEKTTIRNAEITSGLIGDFLSSESNLTVNNSTVNCVIIGSESIEAISAAGAVGRIGISSINDIKINGVNVFASITGSECVGGLIGLVKDGTEFNSSSPLASKCVVAPMIVQSGNNADNNTGLIIGSVSHSKAINKNNINSAIADIIISTYFGDVSAFGKSTNLSSSKYKDMDKPYGKNIEPSVKVINSRDNVKVSIKNLPEFNGYKFDIKTGWISESNDRIEIIESSENYVVLKAKHLADISIIGYYISENNNQIRIPVHFNILSAVRTALKGTGTLSDPYLVANAYDLETVSQYDSEGMVFALSNDITFADSDYTFGGAFYNVGNGIVTIGSAESGFKGTFTGKYNGTIHTIKGLKLSGNAFGGLFGAIDSAKISDLIIDSAEVSGENYSGILAGKAVNSEISNVTIKSSKVNVTEIGGFAGGLIGYADKVNLKNINIDSTAVSTLIDGTSFTTEYAGGIVGSFSGNAVNCTLNNVSVKSTAVAGGVFGESKGAVIVKNCKFNTNISAVVCGGIIGEISNPIETSLTDISVSGSANGTEISGGVFGRISGNESVEKKASPLVKNILVANKIYNCSKCGIVVGDVSEKTFNNFENPECNVFENIYYSSYQNNFGISGNENVNSYQSDEYKVSDINNVKYVSGNEKYDSVLFNSDTVTINEQNISIENIDGNYKSFKVAGITSNLINVTSNIENLITYDDSNSTVKLNKISASSAKIEFVYDTGVVLSLGISQENALSGMGTQNSPYIINNVNDFALMMKTNESGLHYILNNDINLEGLSFTSDFKAELNGNGKVIYNYSGDSLFNTITGSISNLGLMGFKIDSGASESVGALASEIDGGKIYNCFVIADVFADGKVQDAGILAGRMINGANATYVITSGRVISDKAISLGGVAGTIINSEIIKSTSTAYVKGTKNVGGICGTAEFAELSNVIFANMVESTSSVYGNICGEADENTKVNNAYFDSTAAKSQKAFGTGSFNAEALTTDELTTTKIDGFKFTDGYSIPADINRKSFDELFKTGYSFATMIINYLSGLNSGTALNYTSVKVDEKVRNTDIKVDNTNGIIITLLNKNCANKIQRFANPVSKYATQISYTVVDSTKNKTFSDKLLGVMFKTKTDNSSNGLNIFTKANDGAEKLEGIYINDGEMFVDLALPNNYKFDVTAYNESGKELSVSDYSSEGYSVKTNNSQQVNIIVTIKDNSIPWGLHSVWSVIGK